MCRKIKIFKCSKQSGSKLYCLPPLHLCRSLAAYASLRVSASVCLHIARGFRWTKLCFLVSMLHNNKMIHVHFHLFMRSCLASLYPQQPPSSPPPPPLPLSFELVAFLFISHAIHVSYISIYTFFKRTHPHRHMHIAMERNGTLLKISITISISILNCIHIMLCLFH